MQVTSALQAQNWESVSEGTNRGVHSFAIDESTNLLFIGGMFKRANGEIMNGITQWNGSNFTSLGTGMDFCNQFACLSIHAMLFYENILYARIPNPSVSGVEVNGIASWNGNEWVPLGEGLYFSDGSGAGGASTMSIYQDDLIVGGSFDTAGEEMAYSLAGWNGTNWYSLNFPKDESSTFPILVSSSETFQNDLYIGGNFELFIPNEPLTTDIAKYDGTDWHAVGGGIKGPWSTVSDIIEYKNELYICGLFYASAGNAGTGIMKLKDNEWVDVGGSFDLENTICGDMIVYNNELYVSGIFDYVGGGVKADNIAKWDGEKWCGLGSEFNDRIFALGVYNDELYIGGGFETIDQDSFSNIVRWVGGQNVDTCGSIVVNNTNIFRETTSEITIQPNPARKRTTFSYNNQNASDASITLYNFSGKIIMSYKTHFTEGLNHETVELKGNPPGVYFLTIQTEVGPIATEKLIIY